MTLPLIMNPIKSLNINSVNFVNYNINKNYTSNSINIKHNNTDIYIQTPLLDIDKFSLKIKLSNDNCKNDLERDLVNNFLNLDNFTKLYIEKLNNKSHVHTHINYIPTIINHSDFNIKLNPNIKYFLNKIPIKFDDILTNLNKITLFKFIIKCNGLYFENNNCFLKWSIVQINFLTKLIIKKNIDKLDEEINNADKIRNKSSNKPSPNKIKHEDPVIINNEYENDDDISIDF